MKRSVKTISLEYGDARIKFYEIDLKTTSNNIPYLHIHCYYELHFLAGDTFVCSLKDREIKLKRNEFIIVPPEILHRTSKGTSPQEKQFVISMSIDKVKDSACFYDAFISALEKHTLNPISFPAHLENTLSGFIQSNHYDDVLGYLQLKAAAAEFVSWLFGRLLAEKIPLNVGPDNIMILIDNMINRPDITLDEIAAATNYSKRHISRLIEKRYGCTISVLRRQNKIQALPEENKKNKKNLHKEI